MIEDIFNNKIILVTGGTGSIGSEIVRQLLKFRIKKVIIFNRDEIKQYLMKQELDDSRLDYIMGDIRNFNSIQKVFEGEKIDIVFHAAAMKHLVVCEDEPIECAQTNIIGTNNLIRLCVKYKIPKTIAISTDKATWPTSVMGASKMIGERIVLNGNKLSNGNSKFCCVRFGNVSSSRGSIIPVMTTRILKGKNIWISNPDATRFVIRTSDAINLVFRAAELTRGGELFVLKMRAFKVGDMGSVFKDRIAPMLNKEISLEIRSLVPGEKLHENLLNDGESINLLENESMYITSTDNQLNSEDYSGFEKSSISSYTSIDSDFLNYDEIETLIKEYLDEINLN
jgi:FlaA1/EpsC-like NDP-sugar epimerase